MPKLKQGDIFILGDEKHEVLRVDFCSALVRPLAKRRVEAFETRHGKLVSSFEKPANAFHISNNSQVEIVEKEEEK